jgi:hypothetical protein
MLIVCTLYTLYCLYSTHELYYHNARWLGVPCTCAYMVLAAYWGSVHCWYSVVDMSCFQCGCGSSYLLGAVRRIEVLPSVCHHVVEICVYLPTAHYSLRYRTKIPRASRPQACTYSSYYILNNSV